jgi:alpha-D-ribose 1-methylphosphonate 5-triphosphate synthase subunit PhnH
MKREVGYDEVFDAQREFRMIMDCMAHPGKINRLPLMDIQPPSHLNRGSALIGFALLNSDVLFHVSGENNEETSSYIAMNTGAQVAIIGNADFIFINGYEEAATISEAKKGSLSYPEDSATLIVDVDQISDEYFADAVKVVLKGPGIKTETVVYVSGIYKELLQAVKTQNSEFPLGIDLMLADRNCNMICVPRSNQFVVI